MKIEGYYCVQGRTLDGKQAWIGRDVHGSDHPYFAERIDDADMVLSAKSARNIQSYVGKTMKTYYHGDRMALDSFAVHESAIEAREVAGIDDAMRTRLKEEGPIGTPEGWMLMVINTEKRTFATSVRHFSPTSISPTDAVRFVDLGAAIEALDRLADQGFRIFLTRRIASPTPIAADVLSAKIEEEHLTREKEENRIAELPAGETWKPF